MTVEFAIKNGDTEWLEDLLKGEPSLANEPIHWGDDGQNASFPIQFVCDMCFEDLVDEEKALPLVRILIEAGADIDAPHEKHGDTPLIAAASLAQEDVGLHLISLGADIHAKGLFSATALHWAASLGLDRLAEMLIIKGADFNLADETHGGVPMEWAIHGWLENGRKNTRRQPQVAYLLYRAGGRARDEAVASLNPDDDKIMISACLGEPPV